MEIPAINVDGVDEQHVVEAHLENLWKQKLTWRTYRNKDQLNWKLHYHNSITWAFFKVNDNQPINLF
jgi:hypothetical protein